MDNTIFEELFVLELANNHRGSIEKGEKIISEFASVVHSNNIKAAIKLQFRDGENFVHKDFRHRNDILYIKKVMSSKMSIDDYGTLTDSIKKAGLIAMSTPFDEKSVDICQMLNIQIIKIASVNINDKILIEKISKTKRPVIVSTGAAVLKDIDSIVEYFENKQIPLAINHCVSKYPCEKNELELNGIDFLKKRYPGHVIGFSTHEYNDDIEIPMYIAYAKGARTFERHIDLIYPNFKAPYEYCSLPQDIDRWIKAYKKAKEICGNDQCNIRNYDLKETDYIKSMRRGVYAKQNLKAGDILTPENVYFAIPLQKEQLACNGFYYGQTINADITKNDCIMEYNLTNTVVKH